MEITPITVTELNQYMKNKVAEDEFLQNVYIKGEISNFKNHYTGHMYFTLKDEKCLIKCIMFKSYAERMKFMPKDGMKVVVFGTVAVFERDGVYQIYCKAMKEDGIGDLYTAYNELKEKLEKEGLFDIKYKKQIPFMPRRIGVLTSKTGAVIRDIINVSTRRNPNVYIKLLPVPVQGEGAGEKIAKAIEIMNEQDLADVIIVARGGASLEDLWPFNEEVVARAIFNSKLPVISAVGHETDFTIADFVADLRAPTPSAAAELAVPEISKVEEMIRSYQNRYRLALKKKIEYMKLRYEKCMQSRAYKEPLQGINERQQILDIHIKSIINSANHKITVSKKDFANIITKLDTLSPLKTLARGYSITTKNEKMIKSVKELNTGDSIEIRLSDGNAKAEIL